MLRELAVLKGIQHDHIASLEMISLVRDELHVFFPYVDKTLHEVINPTGDPNGGRVLPERVVRLQTTMIVVMRTDETIFVVRTDSSTLAPTFRCYCLLPPAWRFASQSQTQTSFN